MNRIASKLDVEMSFQLCQVVVREATWGWRELSRSAPMLPAMANWVAGRLLEKMPEDTFRDTWVQVVTCESKPQSEEVLAQGNDEVAGLVALLN